MSPIIGTLSSGGSFGRRGGGGVLTATGGSIALVNGFIVHTFTGTENFTVTGGNLTGVEVLLVGGGGGGGTRNAGGDAGGTDGGAGGGGGGFVQVSGQTVSAGTYLASIGQGGTATRTPSSQSPGGTGGDTTFIGLTAKGGGYGGCGPSFPGGDGGPGGSGGGKGGGGGTNGSGGTALQPSQPGLSGSNGFGNAGGPNIASPPYSGAGGGGAGTNGTGVSGGESRNGHGGNGRESTITGSSFTYAAGGGGGGGGPTTTNGGNGGHTPVNHAGSGEMGHGGKSPKNQLTTDGLAASANTGHGGGGGCGLAPGHSPAGGYGGAGGSGIVIVRYPYTANSVARNFKDGSSSANAAGSPLEISLALGTTPSTGVYWFKNPGYNSNTPFQCLADWSVFSQGVMIFCGTNISDNGTRSFSDWGTAATSSSGTPGFRNNFYLPSANLLSSWTGDSNRKFMLGQTAQNGATIAASGDRRWYVMDVTPGVGKAMFDGAPSLGEFKGRVSSSSSGTTSSFWWSTSHGNSIYQMATDSDTVNANLWMETRDGGGDGNHSPVVWGNNNGTYYIVAAPFTSRWMFMGFSPNNFAVN